MIFFDRKEVYMGYNLMKCQAICGILGKIILNMSAKV